MSFKLIALLCAAMTLAGSAPAQARSRPTATVAPAAAPAPVEIAVDPAAADREQIKARLRDWVAGMVTRDPTAIEKVLSSDFQAITYGGRLIDRASDIASVSASGGEGEVKAVTTKEVDVRVYGDAAVVRALLAVFEQRDGKIASIPIRITQTWIRQDGEWRAVADQSTRVEHPELWASQEGAQAAATPSPVGAASPDR